MILDQNKDFCYIILESEWKMSSPIVDMSCLLEKAWGSVIWFRIYFHRTRQTSSQLPRVAWSSENRCYSEDWDIWPASKRYTHFGGGLVHFTQKYWRPVRVHEGSTLSCNANEKLHSDFQFKNGETLTLTKTPMEKTSNGLKFIGRQLLLQLIFAGIVPRSQEMTLQWAVIDCRMTFRGHGQLYVTLSGVNSSGNICILFPDDVDDFTTRPAVDLDVVQIVETMQSSIPLPIPTFRLVIMLSPVLLPSIHLTQPY
jgi:hypothetical protein